MDILYTYFSRETLRDMPQNLTLKRCIKAKLSRSVSKKSRHKPLGFFKQCKYRLSMFFVKVKEKHFNVLVVKYYTKMLILILRANDLIWGGPFILRFY